MRASRTSADGVPLRVGFKYPNGKNPHLGPDPRCPHVLKPHLPIQLSIKDKGYFQKFIGSFGQ